MPGKPHKASAAVALVAAAVGWAMAPVFIRAFDATYDPYTQTVLRYGSGALLLVGISLAFYREDLVKVLRNPAPILGVALLNVVLQCAWVHACCLGTATVAQLLSKLSTVFVIVFSYLLFREERGVIRNPRYLFGTLISFVGVGLVLCKDPASLAPQFDVATGLILLVAVLWAVYVVWCKHLVAHVHAVPMFTMVAVYTTAGFGLLALLFGEPATLLHAGAGITAIAVLSGFICIAIGHPSYHYAQKYLGAALCSSLILLNPLLTNVFALLLWSDEWLTLIQWLGAALLLVGNLLVIRTAYRVA